MDSDSTPESVDDVVLQSMISTGLADKIIQAVTATCVTYAELHGVTFAGFDKTFTTALFLKADSEEFLRVPYTTVKVQAFAHLETKSKE